MGPYCAFCDSRCFVRRLCPGRGDTLMATCKRGMNFDLTSTGYTHETAYNTTRMHPSALAVLRTYIDKAAAEVAHIETNLDRYPGVLAAGFANGWLLGYQSDPMLPVAHRKAAVTLLRHYQAKALSRALPEVATA